MSDSNKHFTESDDSLCSSGSSSRSSERMTRRYEELVYDEDVFHYDEDANRGNQLESTGFQTMTQGNLQDFPSYGKDPVVECISF